MGTSIKQGLGIAAALTASIFVTHWLHELGHALAAKALGYHVIMSSNSVRTVDEVLPTGFDAHVIGLAGPLVTILIAVFAYLYRERLGWLAPIILFNTLSMRVLAAFISLSNPNDEAHVSAELGLGTWTLPAIVCLGLLALFVSVARQRQLHWSWYLWAWLGMSVGYSTVVMGEALLPSFRF